MDNRLVYVTYWKPKPGNPDLRTAVLVRARFDGGTSLADVREIFASSTWTDGPSAARIAFGRDGKIYMTIGTPLSGGTGRYPFVSLASWAQDPAEHAGKVLRLNDDGSTPADNPFVGRPGYKPEIYALGIRNGIGLTVHPDTGESANRQRPQGGDEVNIKRAELWLAGRHHGRAYTTDPDGIRSAPPPASKPPHRRRAWRNQSRSTAVDCDPEWPLHRNKFYTEREPPGRRIHGNAVVTTVFNEQGWKAAVKRCCSSCASGSAT
jgi:hypothetical protein